MTSTERILATLAGKPVDRRAVVPVLSLYGARLTSCPLEQYYTNPAAYARGQAAVRATFQPDVLLGPFDFASLGAAFGGELSFFTDAPPNIRRPALAAAGDWDRLAMPDPDTHPRLRFYQDAIRRMVAELGGDVPVAAVLPAPMDVPELVLGLETWLDTVLFDATGAQRVMEKVIPWFVQLANGLFAAGAAFLAMPSGFASPAVVTRDLVTRFARPVLERTLAQLRGPVVLHHVGASLLAHLDLLAGLPSVIAFALDARDDLGRAREILGPAPVLFGGLDCTKLAAMTGAQVEAACRAILEERRQDSRFILCSAGADIPWSTPPENILALRRAAEAWGAP